MGKKQTYNGYDAHQRSISSSVRRAGGLTPTSNARKTKGLINPRYEDTKILMGLEQQQERLNDQYNLTPPKAEISFDQDAISPFVYPLDGQDYHMNRSPAERILDGMCPLCSNAAHRELDAFYLQNLEKPNVWKQYTFTERQVVNHIVNHVGALYMKTLKEKGKPVATEEALQKLVSKAQKDKEGDEQYAETTIETILGSIAKAKRMYAALDLAFEDDDRLEPAMILVPPSSPAMAPPAMAPPASPPPIQEYCWPDIIGIQSNTGKGLAGRRYAFDFDEQLGPLRPWGDARVNTEITIRSDDAINFYDEMLSVRSMAKRVYAEIMDGEREPIYNKSGEMTGYKDKNYGSAIQAARVVKDVAMDMAKLALIATKDGDDQNQKRALSSTMQSMLTDMGIYSREDTKVVEEQLRKLPAEEMIEAVDALFPTEDVDPSEFDTEFDATEFHE